MENGDEFLNDTHLAEKYLTKNNPKGVYAEVIDTQLHLVSITPLKMELSIYLDKMTSNGTVSCEYSNKK